MVQYTTIHLRRLIIHTYFSTKYFFSNSTSVFSGISSICWVWGLSFMMLIFLKYLIFNSMLISDVVPRLPYVQLQLWFCLLPLAASGHKPGGSWHRGSMPGWEGHTAGLQEGQGRGLNTGEPEPHPHPTPMLFPLANTILKTGISPSALDTITTPTLPCVLWEGFGRPKCKDLPVSRVLLEKGSLFGRQAASDNTCDQLVDSVHHLVICSLRNRWNTKKGFSEKHAGLSGVWDNLDSQRFWMEPK